MNNDFSSLPLAPEMLTNLESLGYQQMTAIQAQSLPSILEGRDLLAQAKTGSGKTAAFGIGLLHKINPRFFGVQALVLCPTRELADQVAKSLRQLARATANIKLVSLCGGTSIGPQIGSLEHGAHIVVGTPGRILKHLRKNTLDLKQVKTFVLDEADRMLDMGFSEDIEQIINTLPGAQQGRQTLLFSATYPDTIDQLSRHVLNRPIEIRLQEKHDTSHIQQRFYETSQDQRIPTLIHLLLQHQPQSTIIFCNTKQQTEELAHELEQQGFSAKALNGDLEQRERDRVWTQFANRSLSILVATDVAARGLDMKELDMVINFELSRDPEIHVHRIGRTGRAGESGLALSLYLAKEAARVNAIEEYLGTSVEIITHASSDDEIDKQARPITPKMLTLQIDGGRKQKIRPGDLLGALTAKGGIEGKQVGKIDLFDHCTYVAVEKDAAKQALNILTAGNIKGKKFRVRLIG